MSMRTLVYKNLKHSMLQLEEFIDLVFHFLRELKKALTSLEHIHKLPWGVKNKMNYILLINS